MSIELIFLNSLATSNYKSKVKKLISIMKIHIQSLEDSLSSLYS